MSDVQEMQIPTFIPDRQFSIRKCLPASALPAFLFQQPRQQLTSARVFEFRFHRAFVTCGHKACKQKQASDTGSEMPFALRIKTGGTQAPGGFLQIVKLL